MSKKMSFEKQAGCGVVSLIGAWIGMGIATIFINLALLAAAIWVVVEVLKYTEVL